MEAILGFQLDLWDYATLLSLFVLAGLGLAVFILCLPGRIAVARNLLDVEANRSRMRGLFYDQNLTAAGSHTPWLDHLSCVTRC